MPPFYQVSLITQANTLAGHLETAPVKLPPPLKAALASWRDWGQLRGTPQSGQIVNRARTDAAAALLAGDIDMAGAVAQVADAERAELDEAAEHQLRVSAQHLAGRTLLDTRDNCRETLLEATRREYQRLAKTLVETVTADLPAGISESEVLRLGGRTRDAWLKTIETSADLEAVRAFVIGVLNEGRPSGYGWAGWIRSREWMREKPALNSTPHRYGQPGTHWWYLNLAWHWSHQIEFWWAPSFSEAERWWRGEQDAIAAEHDKAGLSPWPATRPSVPAFS